jgi:hypothetical protein
MAKQQNHGVGRAPRRDQAVSACQRSGTLAARLGRSLSLRHTLLTLSFAWAYQALLHPHWGALSRSGTLSLAHCPGHRLLLALSPRRTLSLGNMRDVRCFRTPITVIVDIYGQLPSSSDWIILRCHYSQTVHSQSQWLFDFNDNPSCPVSVPHLPKQVKSNAIWHLERDDYFQATVSVWPYMYRLDKSFRIENVTSGEGPEAFRWHRHCTIECKSLYIVPPHRTVRASSAKSSSVIGSAPILGFL